MSGQLPERRRPARFLLSASIGAWAAFLLFYTTVWFAEQGTQPPDIWQRAIAYAISAGLTYAAFLGCYAMFQRKAKYRWIGALGAVLIVTLGHGAISGAVYMLLPPMEWHREQGWLALALLTVFYNTPIVTTAFFALFAVYFGRESAARERALLLSDLAARRAQLETLRYQLNPHFLFNTLNTISNIVMEDKSAEAERAIVLLSKFLRRSIDADPLVPVPLREEFQNVEDYLDIERIRFEDRLHVFLDLDPSAEEWLVPPFLLQPILENVIKHAVAKVIRPVTVQIHATVHDQTLMIDVIDDGPGPSLDNGKGPGLGLSATRERLKLTYGDGATLEATPRQPEGFSVAIRLSGPQEVVRV
ncbi:MAG: histidine kinase [Pseudomonadota bacterium]